MRLALVAAVGFVGTVFAANWALSTYGFVPVWPGLEAPAGVYFAGLAFLLRDIVQRLGGRLLVVASILVGAACSYLIEPRFAVASGVAFLVSELADFAVYTPLAERTFLGGVIASNVVGTVVDSALFLWLAFGSFAFLEGQVVGKLLVTAAALPLLMGARKWATA
jgi:queuosine precursor transporter